MIDDIDRAISEQFTEIRLFIDERADFNVAVIEAKFMVIRSNMERGEVDADE